MSYENNPLISELVGKHGITKEIASFYPEIRVESLVNVIGDHMFAKRTGLDLGDAALILDALHAAYSGIPARRRGGRDGSGMMM